MSLSFLHARLTRQMAVPDSASSWAAACCLDWQAARQAERSCCCLAKPMIIAVIPPTPDRPGPIDLLLCWHHYRASRKSLTATGALLVGIDGAPIAGEEWPPATADPPRPGDRTLSPSSH